MAWAAFFVVISALGVVNVALGALRLAGVLAPRFTPPAPALSRSVASRLTPRSPAAWRIDAFGQLVLGVASVATALLGLVLQLEFGGALMALGASALVLAVFVRLIVTANRRAGVA